MRRVVFLIYPGFELLDVAGAAAVFSGAEKHAAKIYAVALASTTGGVIQSSSGIAVQTAGVEQLSFLPTDTVIIPGASERARRSAVADTILLAALQMAARTAERIGAVSAGSFLLAAAGLLNRKRAVTHWASHAEFAEASPETTVLAEELFVEDDGVWTSAGTTTGIDMALEMVKRDYGNAPAHDVARTLRGRRARARLAARATESA